MIPGSNLLNMALRVISKQTVVYHRFTGRKLNENLQDVAHYAPALTISGSLQAVPRSLYQKYGYDMQENYVNFYTSKALLDVARDCSGDQFTFCGNIYQVLSVTPWTQVDGWMAVAAVQIGGTVAG